MWFIPLFLAFPLVLVAVEQILPWERKIQVLFAKDTFCRESAETLLATYRQLLAINELLRSQITACPAALPFPPALKALKASAEAQARMQDWIHYQLRIHARRKLLTRKSVDSSAQLSMAQVMRPAPTNPCQIPAPLAFRLLENTHYLRFREKEAGFDISADPLRWAYANEEVQSL
jgi:hypothetical protein